MLLIFQLFLDSLVKSTLFIAVPFPLVYVFIAVMVDATRNQARSIDRWKIFPDVDTESLTSSLTFQMF